ncbi:hypothetical protein CDL12_20169 [Handroanthus impetiginosus]|uniref:Uncharacterized protein n=1 Tax=Handroanthus impetiginosus TaxID=429701 RepID=A0A2G9GPS0_9LAMI|nr:hypothetical protein CDL12_20169 [Handroanthus impetiginosus]
MRSVLLFLFILSNLLHAFSLKQPNCFITPKIHVNVTNCLSEPLFLYCGSKDDPYVKNCTLPAKQYSSWKFCEKLPE